MKYINILLIFMINAEFIYSTPFTMDSIPHMEHYRFMGKGIDNKLNKNNIRFIYLEGKKVYFNNLIDSFPNLEEISVASNKVVFSKRLSKLNVKTLAFFSYVFKKNIPKFIYESDSLQFLTLNIRDWNVLDKSISNLQNLKRLGLNIVKNKGMFLDEIRDLKNLVAIDIYYEDDTLMNEIPVSLQSMSNIEMLELPIDISGKIPIIKKFSKLRYLKVKGFINFDKEFEQFAGSQIKILEIENMTEEQKLRLMPILPNTQIKSVGKH